MRLRRRDNRAPGGDGPDAPARVDRGFTLVEIVMTISIMGIVMVPLMNAVITSLRTSATNGNRALVETAIQNAADRVNRAPQGCTYNVYVQAAAQSQGWAAGQASAAYQHWQPGPTPTDQGQWVAGSCVGPDPTADLVQLVTITMTSPDGKLNRTIQVVKSRV
jgi:prepilin-type N-terminal cleavage/methylation domain-containing protein